MAHRVHVCAYSYSAPSPYVHMQKAVTASTLFQTHILKRSKFCGVSLAYVTVQA